MIFKACINKCFEKGLVNQGSTNVALEDACCRWYSLENEEWTDMITKERAPDWVGEQIKVTYGGNKKNEMKNA